MSVLIFKLFVFSFLFQQFWMTGLSTPVKPYMIFFMLTFFYLLAFASYMSFNVNKHLYCGLFFYLYMFTTWFWAGESDTALVRCVGVLLLVGSFLSLHLLYSTTQCNLLMLISNFLPLYLMASLIYYGMGFLSNHDMTFFEEQSGYLGLYQEGVLPSMSGFMDSPNNLMLVLSLFFYNEILMYLKTSCLSMLKIGLVLISLTLTLSVTGFMAMLMPIFMFLLFESSKFAFMNLCMVFIILVMGWYYYSTNMDFYNVLNTRIDSLSTGSGSFELFEFVQNMILESPIFGHGIAQASYLLDGFQGRSLQSAHNSFLEVLIEGGVMALILFMLCWMSFLFSMITKCSDKSVSGCLMSFLCTLFIVSNANMMVYVEMMMFSLFFLYIMVEEYSAKAVDWNQ